MTPVLISVRGTGWRGLGREKVEGDRSFWSEGKYDRTEEGEKGMNKKRKSEDIEDLGEKSE